jgi:NTE family protein
MNGWPQQPPVYDRGASVQADFEGAVATLWEADSWLNPQTGQPELNADLVLEGGGVKGIALAGAICVLAEAGYRFPRAAGTSAGGIVATLVGAVQKSGRDMSVLQTYLRELDYSQFMATDPLEHLLQRIGGKVTDAWELMFRTGLYSGNYLNSWLGERLLECGVATWADLAITQQDDPGMSLPAGQRYRSVVYVSDITRGISARLPWDYQDYYGFAPGGLAVVDAVRATMSIPFFFEPVTVDAAAATLTLPDGRVVDWAPGKVTWVDGGLLMNFPIDAFDRIDGQPPRWPTIGVKLSAEPGEQAAGPAISTSVSEGLRCLQTMMGEWDRFHVDQDAAARTIFVPNGGISATEFNLSPEQQQTLFASGAKAATDFIIRCGQSRGVPRGGARGVPLPRDGRGAANNAVA